MSEAKPDRAWVKWTIRCLIFVPLLMCVWGVLWMYKAKEGVAISIQHLPGEVALNDFPVVSPIAFRQNPPARGLHLVCLLRVKTDDLARWVQRHNGEWSERSGEGSDFGFDDTALQRIGYPGIDVTDRSFRVTLPSETLYMWGWLDSSTGWCMMNIVDDREN